MASLLLSRGTVAEFGRHPLGFQAKPWFSTAMTTVVLVFTILLPHFD
jgi:hypothetical protein